MKNTIKKTSVIFFFLYLGYNALYAQYKTDSLRIVNEAIKLIQFPDPEFSEPFNSNPSPKEIEDLGLEQPHSSQAVQFKMRDDATIHGYIYNHSTKTTVLFLHGALSSSYTNNKASGLLRESLNAKVIALDLRGHGQSSGTPGDVSTPNQYAEDLQDILSFIKKQSPDETIILAGHSMGGGIILRYAESIGEALVDGFVLFAPNLGTKAPTAKQDFDIQNNFLKIHLSRGLGLVMLNQLGIHEYDSLKVVFYNLPNEMPLKRYTYRSVEASTPLNYRNAFKAICKPLLVLVGSKDEAFEVEGFIPIVNFYSKGDIHLIKNETHNGIRHNQESMKKIEEWAIKHHLR